MPPLRLLLYLLASAFAAYLIAGGSLLLANSPRAATVLGVFVSSRHKQRIRRQFPHIRRAQRLITGAGWLGVGLLLAGSVVLTLVIHHA